MDEIKIKVLSSMNVAGPGNKTFIECIMGDGSVWRCDDKGKNWIQMKLNNDDLTQSFYEYQKEQRTPKKTK